MSRVLETCQTAGVPGKERRVSQKRESILHKSIHDVSPSIRCSIGSFNEGSTQHPEMLVTPFAQLLNSLRNIRNNYFLLTNLSPKRSRRLSGYEIDQLSKHSQTNEEQKQRIAVETLEDIEFCLDRLESMLTHPSASQLAAHKFRQIIKQEMSQDPEFSSRSSNSITNYIRTFFDDDNSEGRCTRNKQKTGKDKAKEVKVKETKGKEMKGKRGDQSYHRVKSSSIESLSRLPHPLLPNHAPSISNQPDVISSSNKNNNNNVTTSSNNDDNDSNNNDSYALTTSSHNNYVFKCNSHKLLQQQSSLQTPPKPALKELLDRTDDTWGVDLFELSTLSDGSPLTQVSMFLFQKRGLLKTFNIPERVFFNYWSRVERHYHMSNPYHNNVHATDVLQSTHYMLNFPSFKELFNDLEVFAALFAAGVHDVDHPGVTNLFLINTDSELAILYNDESVLENHHVALAFQLLNNNNKNNNTNNNNINNNNTNNKNDCDILASLDRRQRQQFRKMVVSMVLGTDMSKHLDHVARLKTMVEMRRLSSSSSSSSPSPNGSYGNPVIDRENAEDKLLVLQSLIHCSDLSSPLKPLSIYSQWTDKIMEEFFCQGDKEKELQLDVSPLCDRHSVNVCKSQVGFIDYVVYPLWEAWALLSQPHCQHLIDILDSNRLWVTDQVKLIGGSDSEASSSGNECLKEVEERKE